MFPSHLLSCPFCEPFPIVLSPFLTSLTSALPLSPTSLNLPQRSLNRRRLLFLPLLLSSHLLNLKSILRDLRSTSIIILKHTSPPSRSLNLLLTLLASRGNNNARNLPLAKGYSNSLPHSMPWLAPLALPPLSPKSRKSQFRRSVQHPDLIKTGAIPRGSPSRTLWTNSLEDKLLSPRTSRLLQNHRLLPTPLTPVRRLINPISSNSTEGLCLSLNRPSPRPVLPRRSPSHSNRLRHARIHAGTMILQWISIPLRGSERRKAHPSPVVVIGRVKRVDVGASKRAPCTFLSLSFPLIGL